MDIYKLFESTVASINPDNLDTRDLRRDELLDHYDEAIKALETLIATTEHETVLRTNLASMIEKSKTYHDNKLEKAKELYQSALKFAPPDWDMKELKEMKYNKSGGDDISPHATTRPSSSNAATTAAAQAYNSQTNQSSNLNESDDLEIPLPQMPQENRTSLDRRLSEFLKTFPNLTQTGTVNSNNEVKPSPGYYTQPQQQYGNQQQGIRTSQLPPPSAALAGGVGSSPLMAMMRFPPPNVIAPGLAPPPSMQIHAMHNPMLSSGHDNHEQDMDLSDYEQDTSPSGMIPMVASAMQKSSAKGSSAVSRMNPLPFDPSIMDPRLRTSSSSSKDSRSSSGHRHSSDSPRGSKHGSDKKYSSTHSSSNRNRRR